MADHSGHRDRLRQEFLARPDTFPDHKVLELLLFYVLPRQDTNPLAHELLERFGSLAGVLDAAPEALTQVPGIGERAVALFKTVKELGRRYQTLRGSMDNIITDTRTAAAIMRPYFYGACREMVYLLCMDGKGKFLACAKVSEGSVNAAEVVTRNVVAAALRANAVMVVLAHNHVSGLALPSNEDITTTLYLREVLSRVNVTLADHLIFVDDDVVSIVDSGYLNSSN